MSEKQAQESNGPLFKSGQISVFEHKALSSAFQISEGEKGGAKTYTTVWKKVGNHVLTAAEAGRLYLGNEVSVRVPKKNSPNELFDAVLGSRGIQIEEISKEGKTYTNRTLDIGFAIPMHRKQDNALFGYKVDGVTFFKSVGSKEDPVELSLQDIFGLSKGETILHKDGTQIRMGEICEREGAGKTAQVFVNRPEVRQVQEEIPDLDMEEEPAIEEEQSVEQGTPRVARRV
jgi:hypothetical protein